MDLTPAVSANPFWEKGVRVYATIDPNYCFDCRGGMNMLHLAVEANCENAVDILIEHKADLNAPHPKDGDTPLMLACSKQNYNLVVCLLEGKADPNISNRLNTYPIHTLLNEPLPFFKKGNWASKYAERTHQLRHLLNHGARVDVQNSDKETALVYACQTRNLEAAHVLLQAGANPNICNICTGSLLHAIMNNGVPRSFLRMLLTYNIPLNILDKIGQSALYLACHYRRQGLALELLRAGADPCAGKNPVFFFSEVLLRPTRVRDESVLEMLVEFKADLNQTDEDGETPLQCARGYGYIEIEECLLAWGKSTFEFPSTSTSRFRWLSL